MKLIMTLLVRDEEDIIEENLLFHLNQGVDFIIATDNRSKDATKDILKKYEEKGFLEYFYQGDDTHDQGRWVTKMSRLAYSKYNADWVINNDADEFWWPSKHDDLKSTFCSVSDSKNIIEAKRNNFICLDVNSNEPFYSFMTYKERKSFNSMGNPLPSKQAHRGNSQIIVSDGNHKAIGFDQISIEKDLIEIFHFPIRNKNQLLDKINVGGRALENNKSLPKSIGNTWRKLYSHLIAEGNLDEYLKEHIYDDLKLMKYLDEKHIVKDERLKLYLQGLNS